MAVRQSQLSPFIFVFIRLPSCCCISRPNGKRARFNGAPQRPIKTEHFKNSLLMSGRNPIGFIGSPPPPLLARKFVFFNIPQIQYKNPWVQIVMFKNMTPSPFLKFYLDNAEQVLVDVEGKTNKEIVQHVRTILGKTQEVLQAEEQAQKKQSHPAHFGPKKYCLRECICEVEGQVPCPGIVALPKEMTGKYKAAQRAAQKASS
uniref:Small ribosomal subunit protein mS25 n=1 Tax=Callorhinchus milii TaxID=7868 RepID=A0A4W3KKZ9_CALMI|eukprot:gi/632946638/ref/XP_007888655.1/ PREDICTED: 28S ribosomal protein S25, mitochondrial isoform X2 [Callorhinchus milii]